jgi:hypothetical protein
MQLLGQARECSDLCVHSLDVSQLQERPQAEVSAPELHLGVAQLHRKPHHLIGCAELVWQVLRMHERPLPAVQRQQSCFRRTEPVSHRHRLAGQARALLRPIPVEAFNRQAS